MSVATTITLAVPAPFAIDPARLVAWLVSKGYSASFTGGGDLWAYYRRGSRFVAIPLDSGYADYPRCVRDAVRDAAEAEGIEPPALAALLAPPAPGPALQWEHASSAMRADALAAIEDTARVFRIGAAHQREKGDAERALAAEGRALGLEAAAAWLRGGRAAGPTVSRVAVEALRGRLAKLESHPGNRDPRKAPFREALRIALAGLNEEVLAAPTPKEPGHADD